ncbi:MAG: hypothetical protein A2152_02615 [Candidatus Levybacteria bacterium RBG_16_35_6]|nr:MAG: hypothetical protein A2152_02615 [Candidatus Levybacteria bacterium RBG_16_35_6]
MPRAKRSTKTESKGFSEETFKIEGTKLLGKVKELIKAGNVRSIVIKDKNGREIIQVPLTLGVIGVAIAPALAAVGAIAALVTECTVTVVREK